MKKAKSQVARVSRKFVHVKTNLEVPWPPLPLIWKVIEMVFLDNRENAIGINWHDLCEYFEGFPFSWLPL